MIAAPCPCRAVGRVDDRGDFCPCEEAKDAPVKPLHGDGEHALNGRKGWRALERGELQERADGGEAGVSCARAVSTIALEMSEKSKNERRVDVDERKLGRLLAHPIACVPKQKPERVAVARDSRRTGVALRDEALAEVVLE